VTLDVGDSILIEAISASSGRTKDQIKQELDEIGDLGQIAMSSRAKQRSIGAMYGKKEANLTVRGVYSSLMEIANIQGRKMQQLKIGKISKLLSLAHGEEAKFVIRYCSHSLRIGCAQASFLIAVGYGLALRESFIKGKGANADDAVSIGKRFKKVYHRHPLLDELVIEFLQSSSFGSVEKKFHLSVGIPVLPMLAKPAKSLDEIRSRFAGAQITAEYKYDGERGQIHGNDGTVRMFSRNVKDMTQQFADIIPLILENVKADNFIIDSEIVAYDVERKVILPFQTLMHRSRKGSDEVSPIQVCIFAFDLVFLNGEWLDQTPLHERRMALERIVNQVEHKFQIAKHSETGIDDGLIDLFNQAVNDCTEGLMIKGLYSLYDPGKRSKDWAKLKKDYVKDLGDSSTTRKNSSLEKGEASLSDGVDVVVVGGTMGRGKRTGLYGSFLVAVWNEDCGAFQTICEVGTGFSDQNLSEFTKMFKEEVVSDPPRNVQYGKMIPQFYFRPNVVWEIVAADITVSPTAACCLGDVENRPNAGISLRFGRFLRIREDKNPVNCTSADQIFQMYMSQPITSR
jgi:DNA ligase-1